jgi:hypothetical protein
MKFHNSHPKNVSRSLVVIWFLLLMLAALAPNPAEAQNPIDMLIIPSNNTIFAGDNFVVTVQIQAGTQQLNAADAYLNFDPTKLKVISMTPGTTLYVPFLNLFDNNLGQIGYSAIIFNTTVSGTFDLVSIQFQAIAETSASDITFSRSLPRETAAALLGTSIPLNLTESTVTSTSPVIINELMINPAAVTDANGEWIEFYNPTGNTIDVNTCVLSNGDGSDNHTIASSLPIPPDGYLVLGRNTDTATNGGVSVSYDYGGFYLTNTTDQVILTCDSIEYDRVEYDTNSFPIISGASSQLIDPARDNNIGSNWCESTNAWPGSAGDLGTPGAANDCDATAITLVSFAAVQGSNGVTVTWQTGTEIDNAGFHLHRATAAAGPYTRITTALIQAKGDAVSGASYSYLDTAASDPNQIYFYKLEDIDTSSVRTFHGPVDTSSDTTAEPETVRIYLPVVVK